jgi:lipoate-protein ligase A
VSASLGAIAIRQATAQQEQKWIAFALRERVTQPAVRVWAYGAAAVVLGCSGRSTPAMQERAIAAGVELCTRQTGGGAVLAGPWLLGTSVILPPRHPLIVASVPESFRWFGLGHAAWLRSIGIAARAVPTAQVPRGRAFQWACFASLSHWEVEAGSGKIVGLAQCRQRNGVLFSSAILVAAPPWELLCDVLGESRAYAAALARRTISCTQILARPAAAEALAPSLLLRLATALQALDEQALTVPEGRGPGDEVIAPSPKPMGCVSSKALSPISSGEGGSPTRSRA